LSIPRKSLVAASIKKPTLITFDQTGTLSFICFGKRTATKLVGCLKDLALD